MCLCRIKKLFFFKQIFLRNSVYKQHNSLLHLSKTMNTSYKYVLNLYLHLQNTLIISMNNNIKLVTTVYYQSYFLNRYLICEQNA